MLPNKFLGGIKNHISSNSVSYVVLNFEFLKYLSLHWNEREQIRPSPKSVLSCVMKDGVWKGLDDPRTFTKCIP